MRFAPIPLGCFLFRLRCPGTRKCEKDKLDCEFDKNLLPNGNVKEARERERVVCSGL